MVYLRIKICKSNCTPDCTILYSRVFEKYLLAVESFAKALGIFETCISVNINWYQKLVLSPIKFDERFIVIWHHFLFLILIY